MRHRGQSPKARFRAGVILILALFGFQGFVPGTLRADDKAQSAAEYEVKAAFLYNFAKFVEWPAKAFSDSSEKVKFGILGDDPFGEALDQALHKKTVQGRSVEIKRYQKLADLSPCHLLFISSSEKDRLSEILGVLIGKSVLTVSEVEGFGQLGGVVNFVIEENKVKFEVNPGAAGLAGLKVSSKLLQLARIVKTEARAEKK